MAKFVAIIHKEGDSDYGVSFPDFPGCITAGATLQEAYEMAREALQDHIDIMADTRNPLPALPMTLDDAKTHEFAEGMEALTFIDAFLPAKAKRINVSMDENVVERIDAVCKNRSRFLEEAALERLDRLHG